jgi:hypothetical protein
VWVLSHQRTASWSGACVPAAHFRCSAVRLNRGVRLSSFSFAVRAHGSCWPSACRVWVHLSTANPKLKCNTNVANVSIRHDSRESNIYRLQLPLRHPNSEPLRVFLHLYYSAQSCEHDITGLASSRLRSKHVRVKTLCSEKNLVNSPWRERVQRA